MEILKNANVQIYFGEGKGKTTAALGQCIQYAGVNKQVVIVQFLKGKTSEELEFLKRLEPEIKVFRFEKSDCCYEHLTEQEKQEQEVNIHNGLHYARKVVDTKSCDVLVLDEILGLLDHNIVGIEEMKELISLSEGEIEIILTGRELSKEVEDLAGFVYQINTIKEMEA